MVPDLRFIPETIRAVAEAILKFRVELRQADREQRTEVADFFENVGKSLAAATAQLRDGEVPNQRCGEMYAYARQLPQKVGGVVKDKAEIEKLSEQLARACIIEGLGEHFQNAPELEEQLNKLDEAVGKFCGLAVSIRPSQ